MLRVLIRTASDKEGGRNTRTEVCGLSDVEGFDQNCLQTRKEAGTPGLRYVDCLMLRVLIRTASDKEGGRNTRIEVCGLSDVEGFD